MSTSLGKNVSQPRNFDFMSLWPGSWNLPISPHLNKNSICLCSVVNHDHSIQPRDSRIEFPHRRDQGMISESFPSSIHPLRDLPICLGTELFGDVPCEYVNFFFPTRSWTVPCESTFYTPLRSNPSYHSQAERPATLQPSLSSPVCHHSNTPRNMEHLGVSQWAPSKYFPTYGPLTKRSSPSSLALTNIPFLTSLWKPFLITYLTLRQGWVPCLCSPTVPSTHLSLHTHITHPHHCIVMVFRHPTPTAIQCPLRNTYSLF